MEIFHANAKLLIRDTWGETKQGKKERIAFLNNLHKYISDSLRIKEKTIKGIMFDFKNDNIDTEDIHYFVMSLTSMLPNSSLYWLNTPHNDDYLEHSQWVKLNTEVLKSKPRCFKIYYYQIHWKSHWVLFSYE